MDWICRYYEFDTEHYGVERVPFGFTTKTNDYNAARLKAGKILSQWWDDVDFEVYPVDNDDARNEFQSIRHEI